MTGGTIVDADAGADADGGVGGVVFPGVSRLSRAKTAVTPQPNPQTPRMMKVKNPTAGMM
jgi:hypothetical protein